MEIAVISGKGGTGKSSIAAAFAAVHRNIILADCDVDAANQYLLFEPVHEEETVYASGYKAVIDYEKCTGCSICESYCRFDAISKVNDRVIISETGCDGCFLCQRVCPENAITMAVKDKSRMYSGSFRYGKMVYGRLAPGEENSGRLVNMVREKARQMASECNIDIILIDGPPGTGCPVISSITGVNKIVIVTEPTISGLMDLQRVSEVIKRPAEIHVIINKSDLNPAITGKIVLWCRGEGIDVAGTLPFDAAVTKAMVQLRTINEYSKTSPASRGINKIWNTIINKIKT